MIMIINRIEYLMIFISFDEMKYVLGLVMRQMRFFDSFVFNKLKYIKVDVSLLLLIVFIIYYYYYFCCFLQLLF